MSVYYNEHDPFAAAWLQDLMRAGLIPEGDVDERSIADVQAVDVVGYDQCHWFAGIGGWPLALDLAGWPRDRPVWTGSCPCQPFSAAGQGKGTADPRHLWPELRRLVAECRPAIAFGEQVASRLGRDWLAGVRLDLEDLGYAVGCADLCAASVRAPHIRQRLYWVAHSQGSRWLGRTNATCDTSATPSRGTWHLKPEGLDPSCGLANTRSKRVRANQHRPDDRAAGATQGAGDQRQRVRSDARAVGGLGDPAGERGQVDERGQGTGSESLAASAGGGPDRLVDADGNGRQPGDSATSLSRHGSAALPASDAWSEFESIPCRDGKARRTQPGLCPLAHGVSGRMVVRLPDEQADASDAHTQASEHWYNRIGALRGFGNAIVPQVAAVFIQAFMDTEGV